MARSPSMTADGTLVATLQRSWWSLVESANQLRLPQPLLWGSALLFMGTLSYILAASSYAYEFNRVQAAQTSLLELESEHMELIGQFEEMRSPNRLSKLAQRYEMVPPTPKTVWRMQ